MSEESLTANRRRSYTPQFKAEMVAQCLQPNVSLASLAVEHGMNPNVLHRWVSEHERYGRHTLTDDPASVKPVRCVSTRVAAVIRIDQIWLSVEPVDMRCGVDRLLARVIEVFGRSQPHHAYVFANRRGSRLKVLVCDGFGVWLAVRRLHQGSMHWPSHADKHMPITPEQAQALVIGLPWQRLAQFDRIDTI